MRPHTSREPECPRCKQDGVIHCEQCNGSGRAVGDVAECRDCHGTGNLGPKPELLPDGSVDDWESEAMRRGPA